MTGVKDIELEQVRRYFAEEIRAVCNLRTEALVEAFASVPRERFLGPGPWKIRGVDAELGGAPYSTPDDDPRHVYHNVSVVIDLERQLYNGQPGTIGLWIDTLRLKPGDRVLHIGCAAGYYTALIAKMVGSSGHVTAIEIDPKLAASARRNCADQEWVDIVDGNATADLPSEQDAIVVNAGVTHPLSGWLDALRTGGRMVLPVTFTVDGMPGNIGKGVVFLITRESDGYSVRFISLVAIYSCCVARDSGANARLQTAIGNRNVFKVQSLRRDRHEPEPSCWLHGPEFCFSCR